VYCLRKSEQFDFAFAVLDRFYQILFESWVEMVLLLDVPNLGFNGHVKWSS
jgi:hypothetical protein